MTPALILAIQALLESIMADEARSGGLLSRRTLRLAAELAHATEAALSQLIAAPQKPRLSGEESP